ncbi:MAG: transglycosylase domain-containing protein [Dysgonamonadaceae bacterium]|jgi:penicillin-binding protein 1A|nr:transglycosylase domain-containing protein [Dysgonamonadaceae bacterium]
MTKKDRAKPQKFVKRFWITFGVLLVSVFLFFLMIARGWIGYLPPVEDLENPIDKYASRVVSADLQTMGTYAHSKDNRIYVNYKELSPAIIQALIATEDARFMDHSGIDIYALMRAFVKRGLLFQKSGGGGSTISQQLAKLLYSEHASSVIERLFQKPIEWVIAVQLERYYTKEEIINMYLNKFDFLYNAVGIQSACWVYFGKLPKEISVEEAATLIGMCKNPSYYNPLRKVERTQGRRNVVLNLMRDHDYISQEECTSLKALPLVTRFHKIDHTEGIAPYFREYLRILMTAKKPDRRDYPTHYRYVEDSLAWETNPLFGWCNKNRKPDGSYYNIYTDGLQIYTTIDSRMQDYAEQAVTEHIGGYLQPAFFKEKAKSSTAPYSRLLSKADVDKILERTMKQTDRYHTSKRENQSEQEIRKVFDTPVEMQVFSWQGLKDTIKSPMDSIRYMKMFLRAGFMAMDTHSGAIKAYVGGIDYKHFQYDMVSMGKRQVGSTIKPYLYSLAMESGFSPCNEVMHTEQTLITETGQPWTPRNTVKTHIGEMVTLRWGLQQSDNWISAYLMGQLNPYAFKNMLISSFGFSEPIAPVVSLCLGPCEVSVKEMVSGYSTFANGGFRVEPLFVSRIEDKNGNVIASFSSRLHEAITEDANYKMLSMLRSVVDGGTAGGMRSRQGITAPMGGKTGTTNNNSDCWFMGFTPSLVGGCWVGGDDRDIHFSSMNEGQGSRAAMPVMGIFLKKVFADSHLGYSPTESFTVPEKYSDPCRSTREIIDESNYSPGVMDDIFN